MIINGGKRSFWRKFAPHLMKTENGQQKVRIVEIRGLAADNVADAFQELEALGRGTRAKNFYYHANIDPRADEIMTDEQWEYAVDLLEKNLGLEGQERFIVEHYHEDDGRTHRHVVWSRVTDDMKVVPCDWNYSIHQKTADALEQEFGHEPTPRQRENGKPRGPEGWEYVRGKETKVPVKEVEAELAALWQQADTGQAFAAALEEKGYILCEGNKGLCVVDEAGKEHSLARRVALKKKEVDARMADVDRDALPSVAEARALARERAEESDDRDERHESDPAGKKRDVRLASLAEDVAEVAQQALKRKASRADKGAPEQASPGGEEIAPAPDHSADAPSPPEPAPAPSPTPEEAVAARDADTGPAAAERPAPAPFAVSVPEQDAAEASRPTTEPQPHIPIARRQPSLFERLRDKLAQGAEWFRGEPTVAESAEPQREARPRAEYRPPAPWEPSPPERVLADSGLTRFERLAGELAHDAKAGTPALAEITVTAAAVAAVAAPALSEFDRVTHEHQAAHATGGEASSFAAELAWLARRLPPGDVPPPGQELTPFERVTQDMQDAARSNGGQPEPGFWERGVAFLASARDGFLNWARETARGFAGRIEQSRDRGDRDGPGIER